MNSAWIALEINHLLRLVLLPHKPEDNLEELVIKFLAFLAMEFGLYSCCHDVLRRDAKEEKLSAEELDFIASFDIAVLYT